jgi:hypothetical protein
MKVTLLLDPTDMEWLRDVHMPNNEDACNAKAAILYGNEDSPERIELFDKALPEIKFDDERLAYVRTEEGYAKQPA